MARPVAVISGATSGIGHAVALRLAADGYRIIGFGTNEGRLGALAEQGIEPLSVDVRSAQSVDHALAATRADVLIHAAGVLGTAQKLHEMSPDAAAQIVDVNLIGAVNLIRATVPGMIARRSGYVILFGSVAGRFPGNGPTLYSASKAAISAMALGLRNDVHGSGVRVTEIVPGRVATGMHSQLDEGDYYSGLRCLDSADVAAQVAALLAQPAHVNISQLEIVPTEQTVGGSRFATALQTRQN